MLPTIHVGKALLLTLQLLGGGGVTQARAYAKT